MALPGDDDVFERLKKASDPEAIKEKSQTALARHQEQYQKAQKRYGDLIRNNSTQPVHFESIQVLGAFRTRDAFLRKLVEPALSKSQNGELTLKSAIDELRDTVRRLDKFDIFHPNIQVHLDTSQTRPPSSPFEQLPISATIALRERGRVKINAGTSVGNTEGNVDLNAALLNIFGGAEALRFDASLGTKRRFAHAALSAPINASPFANWELKAFSTSTDNTQHASHVEVNNGIIAAAKWEVPSLDLKQELGYQGVWRQITDLHPEASQFLRQSAGDAIKSAITYTISRDTRDSKLMPSTGSLLRLRNELAGVGPLAGTICHLKSEVESAVAFPVPFLKNLGVTFNSSLRGGMLYPLVPAGASHPKPSNVADRFQLGGATDVRGFHMGGLGPHSGRDALGGDAFIAGSASLLFPMPRTGPDSGLRFHTFINGGRLMSLQPPPNKHNASIAEGMRYTLGQLINQAPSLAAGFGVVYTHPVARFEMNFCLPLTVRGWSGHEGSEKARKGLQFGVGIEFL